jgi:serine/threonine-protein kinase SRPK3
VAIKVCVSSADLQREVDILNGLPRDEPDARNVVRLLDSFSLDGPNGKHAVLVFDILGDLKEIMWLPSLYDQVKSMCRHFVRGVAFLHRQGIVHGGRRFRVRSRCFIAHSSCGGRLIRYPFRKHRGNSARYTRT